VARSGRALVVRGVIGMEDGKRSAILMDRRISYHTRRQRDEEYRWRDDDWRQPSYDLCRHPPAGGKTKTERDEEELGQG
jgi:hypothetical protein